MSSFSCLNFHNSTKMGIKDQYASATCRMTLQSAVISWRRRNAVCSERLPGCPPAHAHKEPLSVFGHDIHPFPFFSTILVWLSSPSFFFFSFFNVYIIYISGTLPQLWKIVKTMPICFTVLLLHMLLLLGGFFSFLSFISTCFIFFSYHVIRNFLCPLFILLHIFLSFFL